MYLVGPEEDEMSPAPGTCQPSEKVAIMIIFLDQFNNLMLQAF